MRPMLRPLRLRTLGLWAVMLGFLAGAGAVWLWMASVRSWDGYLGRAYDTGVGLYETLRDGAPPPEGVTISPLPPGLAALASRGDFARLPGQPFPAQVTHVSFTQPGAEPGTGRSLTLGVVTGNLQYPVSRLAAGQGGGVARKLGEMARLLASYCSEPVVYARWQDGDWLRVDAQPVWGCDAAPRDLRLPALLLSLLALVVLVTVVTDSTAQFDRFARALRDRRRLGGPESYASTGPMELREIVSAVNASLEEERAQLEQRAVVLSGVSHDLGTPATRLRLRAALIADPELRARLEADIDRMTGMIESVLTLTRSELGAEAPRQVSLGSLVSSVVADYADLGQPVDLRPPAPRVMRGGGSLFSSQRARREMPAPGQILVTARPVALQRALSNLIDNALKYGRRAHVRLETDPRCAVIAVEDEGTEITVEEIEQMIAPFRRGDNRGGSEGFGLGLTIVERVAQQHGGRLYFEAGARGLRACLEIRRG